LEWRSFLCPERQKLQKQTDEDEEKLRRRKLAKIPHVNYYRKLHSHAQNSQADGAAQPGVEPS